MKQYSVSITFKEGYCSRNFTDIYEALSFVESLVKLMGEGDLQYIRIDIEETEEDAQ